MECFAYYDHSGSPWSETEDAQLIKEYTADQLDILQIGYIHKRTPGGISYRLRTHNLIDNNVSARGYMDYINSDLYKEIVSSSQTKKAKAKEKKELSVGKATKTRTLELEVHELKEELRTMKASLNEMHEMFKAVYKFETQVVITNVRKNIRKKGTLVNTCLL